MKGTERGDQLFYIGIAEALGIRQKASSKCSRTMKETERREQLLDITETSGMSLTFSN
jgi:hypothetical protein